MPDLENKNNYILFATYKKVGHGLFMLKRSTECKMCLKGIFCRDSHVAIENGIF